MTHQPIKSREDRQDAALEIPYSMSSNKGQEPSRAKIKEGDNGQRDANIQKRRRMKAMGVLSVALGRKESDDHRGNRTSVGERTGR